MTPRDQQLTEAAVECLAFERLSDFTPEAARAATRDVLTEAAQQIGFATAEIPGAVEAALKAASNIKEHA